MSKAIYAPLTYKLIIRPNAEKENCAPFYRSLNRRPSERPVNQQRVLRDITAKVLEEFYKKGEESETEDPSGEQDQPDESHY